MPITRCTLSGMLLNRQKLLLLARNDSRDVFLLLGVVFESNEILSAFQSKHDLKVNLRVARCYKDIAPWRAAARSQFIKPRSR